MANKDLKTVFPTDLILEEPEKAPTILAQIEMSIKLHYNPDKRISSKIKRGRPEYIKDCDDPILDDLLNQWEKELERRLCREQRSDALFASVGRYIKKIPDLFLKYIGSKCQYKSKGKNIIVLNYFI